MNGEAPAADNRGPGVADVKGDAAVRPAIQPLA
jgi:hypothetical protein